MAKTFLEIFSEINKIPRPSHHEGKIADFLCAFAQEHGLNYRRDKENCVVIEKPATPGYENAEPVVILNHMDMVCVAKDGYLRDGRAFDPLTDEIRPYIDEVKNADGSVTRWMKAEGTSLGADNGMGLSMALAVLADDTLVHPALEVLTTTNEEDGMSGAEALSTDFIKGKKVVNLDSEAFDEITVGAAGAYLQVATWKVERKAIPLQEPAYLNIRIDGGLGGHSGVDINKGRCNCIKAVVDLLHQHLSDKQVFVCEFNGGTANASIPSWAEAVVAIPSEIKGDVLSVVSQWEADLHQTYDAQEPGLKVKTAEAEVVSTYIPVYDSILTAMKQIRTGVYAMREDMVGTVMTSNNMGMIRTGADVITVSCHSRSFSNEEMREVGQSITRAFQENGADNVNIVMDTPAWVEREDSPLLALTCQTFQDVLGFAPKKVAMHFVLEAAYYVEKYPGVEIASIGPRIIEPHSTSERVDLDTAEKIWKVTVELLKRLAE